MHVFIAYFLFLPDSDTCGGIVVGLVCSDNSGYVGDRGACFSSGGGGRAVIGGSRVFICRSFLDKLKTIASFRIVAFVLFVPGGE